MLQIAMVTAFTGYKLIRENQKGVGGYNYPPRPHPNSCKIEYLYKCVYSSIKERNSFCNIRSSSKYIGVKR